MIKIDTKRKIIALLAVATLISIVNASVFVYYPISLTVSPQEPPVVFQEGSNAGQPDLRGKTISVTIGDEGTNLSIKIHPTLQKNYYYKVVRIVNKDASNAYYLKFRVTEPITDSRVAVAYLIVEDTNIKIDLKSTDLQPTEWIRLGASQELSVSLYLRLTGYSGSDIEVKINLITATQTNETPPTPPEV